VKDYQLGEQQLLTYAELATTLR
jgi:hypothetical protein